MSVSVLITDRKVYNKYGNGDSFNLNLGEFATYLRAGVMNVQKAVYTVEIGWNDVANTSTGVEFSTNGNKLTRNSGSWIDEGFSIGDTITFTGIIPVASSFTRLITNITESLIIFDGAPEPVQTYTGAVLDGGATDLFALEYSFGIIPNNAQASYESLLDGADQTYYAADIGLDTGGGRVTTFVNMQPKSPVRSWMTSRAGATRVRFVSRTTSIQTFEVEHEYVVMPYNDASLFTGNLTLKYVSKFDFRATLPNINTAKIAEDDIQLGSVGNFDENYDGYNNDFNITNLIYTDVATLSPVTELNIKSKTRVTMLINSTSGLFNTTDPVVFYNSYMPTPDIYSNKTDDFYDIWLYDSIRNEIDGVISGSYIITNASSTFINANQISAEFDVEITPALQTGLEEGFLYRLAVEVGDGDTATQTNNVTLLIDENSYSKDSNITDLIISDGFGFNPYYKFISPTVDLFSNYFGWIEDEVVSYHRFGVNRTALKDAQILSGKFKVIAYEDATGETFDLQSEELDLSEQLTVPVGNPDNPSAFSYQLIQDERTRGYRLPAGDEFNLLLWETDDEDATYKYYEWRVGFKMNWQSWIALPDADSVFIDATDTFNGLNNRASNYSLKNGWSIRVQWQFDMQGLDDESNVGETEYNFFTDQFSIYDFMEQDNDPTTWDCLAETYDSLGNLLGQALNGVGNAPILYGEETFIKVTYTPTAPFVIADITPYWGEIRIAEDLQQGFNNDVLSTTKPYLPNNRLLPLDGETRTKITLVANTIVLECKTNVDLIKKDVDYKLSDRLANVDEPIAPFVWTFTTENDISTETFDPSVTAGGGEVVTWTLKQGTNYTINSLNIPSGTALTGDELDGTCQDVDVTFSTNDPSNITGIDAYDDQLCQSLDLSLFTNLDEYRFNDNNITGVTFPTSTNASTIVYFDMNAIAGVVDLSGLSSLGGDIRFNDNLITDFTFPSTSISITRLYLYNNSIATAMDLTNLTNLSGDIRLQNNSITSLTFANSPNIVTVLLVSNNSIAGALNLSTLQQLGGNIRFQDNSITSVTFPTASTQSMSILYFYNNSISGNVDISGFSKLGGDIRFYSNSITGFTLPVSSTGTLDSWDSKNNNHGYIDFTIYAAIDENNLNISLNNNVLSVADVNQVLIDLDGILTLATGTTKNINLAAQTPAAAPTGAGLAAKDNLINVKGYNVITD